MFLLIVYVFGALGFSFFCSIAEAALLSVTPSFVAALEQRGRRAGRVLRRLKSDVNRPLAAILTLNTIAHTVGAAGAGAQAADEFGSAYLGLASGVLTLLILVFSEIIPKTLGATYWRTLAPLLAPAVDSLVFALYPFVLASEALTRLLSRGGGHPGPSREELAALADLGARGGLLEHTESRVLRNLFRLRDTRVGDIMTPRIVVFSLPGDTTVAGFLDRHHAVPFSRIPLHDGDPERITGFALRSDLLVAGAEGRGGEPLSSFRREIGVVPETAGVHQLFEKMLSQREQMELVVDEYGGVAGVVTLEDVVETLLGLEIVDEGDRAVDMRALARSLWERRARRMGIDPGPRDGGGSEGQDAAAR